PREHERRDHGRDEEEGEEDARLLTGPDLEEAAETTGDPGFHRPRQTVAPPVGACRPRCPPEPSCPSWPAEFISLPREKAPRKGWRSPRKMCYQRSRQAPSRGKTSSWPSKRPRRGTSARILDPAGWSSTQGGAMRGARGGLLFLLIALFPVEVQAHIHKASAFGGGSLDLGSALGGFEASG